MATALAQQGAPTPTRRQTAAPAPLDFVDRLFVVSAFVAPLSLFLVKSFTVYDVMIVCIAVLIAVGPRRMEPLPRFVVVAALVFLVAALVSSFRASHQIEALTQTLQFVFIFFVQLPVVLTVVRSPRVLRGSLLMFMAGSFFSIVVALAFQTAQGADRILVFYSDNPNRLGYPSAYLLPFVAYFVAGWWRAGRRFLAIAVGASLAYLMLWALAGSASRGATLATIVAVTVYFVLRPQAGVGVTALRVALTLALTVVVVMVLTKSGLFPFTLGDRITRTFSGEEQSSLINDRASLARAGLTAFEESPLVGTGLDNFRYVAPLYAEGTTLQVPHNLWIQFLAQIGLVGTLAFLYFVLRWFVGLLREHRTTLDPERRVLCWAFVASMAAIMTILMTIPILNDRHYWLLLGLGMAVVANPAAAVPGSRGRS